jgi:hypothetical protein
VDLRHNRIKRPALVEHLHDIGHHICVKNAKFITIMDHYGKRKIWEAMEIEINENNLNKDEGLKLRKHGSMFFKG